MGRARVGRPGALRRILLCESTLIGRHWRCDAILADPGVPLYWFEIRWLGERWAWRCLGAEGLTTGSGAQLGEPECYRWLASELDTHIDGWPQWNE